MNDQENIAWIIDRLGIMTEQMEKMSEQILWIMQRITGGSK